MCEIRSSTIILKINSKSFLSFYKICVYNIHRYIIMIIHKSIEIELFNIQNIIKSKIFIELNVYI